MENELGGGGEASGRPLRKQCSQPRCDDGESEGEEVGEMQRQI